MSSWMVHLLFYTPYCYFLIYTSCYRPSLPRNATGEETGLVFSVYFFLLDMEPILGITPSSMMCEAGADWLRRVVFRSVDI